MGWVGWVGWAQPTETLNTSCLSLAGSWQAPELVVVVMVAWQLRTSPSPLLPGYRSLGWKKKRMKERKEGRKMLP